MDAVAPPPGATHGHTLRTVANPNCVRAPGVQLAANPNARCVLRSDQLGLSHVSSIILRLYLNRKLFGPRHTPYLLHGSAVRHMDAVAPPPGATHGHTLRTVANPNCVRAPGVQLAANPNARCVLRSDQLGLSHVSSITLRLYLNRKLFGPRHTPYLSHGSAVRHTRSTAPPSTPVVLRGPTQPSGLDGGAIGSCVTGQSPITSTQRD
jgi:hypothetical protein